MSNLDAALQLAARGWNVFPVPPDTKKSYISGKKTGKARWGQTRDPNEITRLWSKYKAAGIGVPTGAENGIFVLETDTEAHGADGDAALKELTANYGSLPLTLTAQTPSGSRHYYFRHPGNLKVYNSASYVAPGVDIRGDGGMVVAPPTSRKGKLYVWVDGATEPADAPAWLMAMVTRRSKNNEPADASGNIYRVESRDRAPLNAFEAYGQRMAETPRVDVDELLDHMVLGNIDTTQQRVVWALANANCSIEEVLERLLPKTMEVSGETEQFNIHRITDKYTRAIEAITKEREDEAALPDDLIHTLDQWSNRELGEPDYLLGHVFSTTTRGLISADTGLGKTLLGVSMGMHMSLGLPFLHWDKGRKCTVLYLDGEMSRRLLRRRLEDEVKRIGIRSPTFYAVSSEDLMMQPLNTVKGQRTIDKVIERFGGINFIVFDNIMSLISGNQAEEEGWAAVQTWARTLTQRNIGQLWVHHSGHNTDRQYGTKTREWQMDLYIHLTKLDNPNTDVNFKLEFKKARERLPEYREEYTAKNVALINGGWTVEGAANAGKKPLPPFVEIYWRDLNNVFVAEGSHKEDNPTTTIEAWKAECVVKGHLEDNTPSRNRFSSAKSKMQLNGWIDQTNNIIKRL